MAYQHIKRVQKRLNSIPDQVITQLFTLLARQLHRRLRQATPRRSGKLANSWRLVRIKQGDTQILRVFNNSGYAAYVFFARSRRLKRLQRSIQAAVRAAIRGVKIR